MEAKDRFQYILGGLIVTGFFILLYLLVASEVPETNKDLLNLVVGALIGSFAGVVQYFFGSSSGSAKKTEIMEKQKEEIKGFYKDANDKQV